MHVARSTPDELVLVHRPTGLVLAFGALWAGLVGVGLWSGAGRGNLGEVALWAALAAAILGALAVAYAPDETARLDRRTGEAVLGWRRFGIGRERRVRLGDIGWIEVEKRLGSGPGGTAPRYGYRPVIVPAGGGRRVPVRRVFRTDGSADEVKAALDAWLAGARALDPGAPGA